MNQAGGKIVCRHRKENILKLARKLSKYSPLPTFMGKMVGEAIST
jgi:hypothetical protein